MKRAPRFWALLIVSDRTTKELFDRDLNVGPRLQSVCFHSGIYIIDLSVDPGKSCGDRALLAPSFSLEII